MPDRTRPCDANIAMHSRSCDCSSACWISKNFEPESCTTAAEDEGSNADWVIIASRTVAMLSAM